MKPVVPFEPIRKDTIPEGDRWTYEIKWDGVRILTYADGGRVRLFNRRLHERTLHYPELHDTSSYARGGTFILDGEVIALGRDGKPSFHEVMRRDGIRRMERVSEVQRAVPVFYIVFDVLYLNGNWVHEQPLRSRLDILRNLIIPGPHVQLAASHPNGEQLFHMMRQQGMEGIVCKNLDSPYIIGGKGPAWVKVKNYGDIVASIGGFTLSGGVVNAVLLGLYDSDGRYWYVGHTGTGKLSKEEWRRLTDELMPDVVPDKPFVNKPERHQHAYWVRPRVSVKVMYTEWRLHEGRSLRQPSIQSFVDVPPKECVFPAPPQLQLPRDTTDRPGNK